MKLISIIHSLTIRSLLIANQSLLIRVKLLSEIILNKPIDFNRNVNST